MVHPNVMKYWPLVVFTVSLAGAAVTYYVSMAAVAAEVTIIQQELPRFARVSIVELQFQILENQVERVEDEVDENEERSTEQYLKLEGKLDKVIDLLLKQAADG